MKYIIQMPSIEGMWSEQWNKWINQYAVGRDDIEVRGTDTTISVSNKDFNNMREYYRYFFKQMSAIMEDVKNNDTVFFVEGESAGIEALEYLRKMDNININIEFIFHGGSYLPFDTVTQRGVHAENFERGWFDIASKIYVATSYHADMIRKYRGVPREKLVITGLPMDFSTVRDGRIFEKKIDILFAGRLNTEKGYDIVNELRDSGYNIVCSKEHNWSKREFYENLVRSKVLFSPAKTETLGISVMEALANNVPVVVPNSLGYVDFVPKRMRYKNGSEMIALLDNYVAKPSEDYLRDYVEKYDKKIVLEKWFH